MSQSNGSVSNEDARDGALVHIVAFVGSFFSPFNLILPIVAMFLVSSEFAKAQAAEAFNFQLSLTIYAVVCVLLCFVLIGFILLPVVIIAGLVLPIIAAVRVRNGIAYRYPMTLRVL